jgi:prepilin-type N-terminal cleavage/methylation domain-containing protein
MHMTTRRSGMTVIEMIIVVSVIALIAVISIPGLLSSRKHSNETSAIATLRLIASSQAVFRESDRDGDGRANYATLPQLEQAKLVDEVVGAGTKHGYSIQVAVSTTQPETLWFAVANPVLPGNTGDRYFAVNHAGVVFYTDRATVALNTTDSLIPTGMIPVSQ